jgi:hypothetical protein
MSIKTIFAAVIVAGAALAGVSQASAMPIGPAPDASPGIEHVAYGCGPGFAPNGWGRCVPVMRPRYVRPYYARPVYRSYRRPYYGYRRGW